MTSANYLQLYAWYFLKWRVVVSTLVHCQDLPDDRILVLSKLRIVSGQGLKTIQGHFRRPYGNLCSRFPHQHTYPKRLLISKKQQSCYITMLLRTAKLVWKIRTFSSVTHMKTYAIYLWGITSSIVDFSALKLPKSIIYWNFRSLSRKRLGFLFCPETPRSG